MSYVDINAGLQYLIDLKDGRIKQGLGLGHPSIDEFVRYKKSELTMILGFDNVGKTDLILWYYLMLSMKYGFRWNILTAENQFEKIMKRLVEYKAKKHLVHMNHDEISRTYASISYYFNFLDNNKLYTHRELLNLFEDNNPNGCLIDPYTGLKRGYTHTDNYDFLNETREWINRTTIPIFINTHPVTEAGRRLVHPKGHDLEGHLGAPRKADTEGGLSFANRTDNFWVVHRYTQHETRKYLTEWHVVKNKDNDTGGGQTMKDSPLFCEFNKGLGFVVNGVAITPSSKETVIEKLEPMKPNSLFDEHKPKTFSEKVDDWFSVGESDDEAPF